MSDSPVAAGFRHDVATATPATFNQFGTFPEQWYGVYFQDHVTLWKKVHLLGGGRYDWTEAGAIFPTPHWYRRRPVKPKSAQDISARGSASSTGPGPGYPSTATDVNSLGSNNVGTPLPGSGPLELQTGRQWEGGIKTEFFDGRLTSTPAYFDVTKQNVATPIPGTPFIQTIGEANSRGMELDVSVRITEQLSVIGSYAYADTRITGDNSENEDHRLISVPKNSGSLWAVYEFTHLRRKPQL
jgi:iron complex outermembrane receptor protein